MLNRSNRLGCLLLAAVLLLCPVMALAAQTAAVQVVYASPEGNFAFERIEVSPANSVVAPNPDKVPEGYIPVNTNPVPLIFNEAGTPIPSIIYFTYQKGLADSQIRVNYATLDGTGRSSALRTVSPDNNLITPDAAMVPEGYVALNDIPITVNFDQNGKPLNASVTFYYADADAQLPSVAPSDTTTTAGSAMGWNVPGEIVTFGWYEQDGNTDNRKEPIEWYVIEVKDGKALLLSRYALFSKPFHNEWKKVNWKSCDLRKYLNGTFYKNSFTASQQEAIQLTANRSFYTDNYVETEDRVFLLNADEAKQLSKELLLCQPTKSSDKKVVTENGYCNWWLRDTTNRKNDANRVLASGDVFEYGGNTNASGLGVRPAIWVDVEKAFGDK